MHLQIQRCGDSHSSTQMHYLNVLDKCSQIMREDRIWLRTQIKNNSEQALSLFKGLSKMPNMKQLQIKLRKYVNNTKQKEKQQQLNKFKENMNSTHNIGIKQHFNCKQNSRESHQKNKTMQTNRHQNSSHSRSPLQQRNQNRQSKSLLSKWNNYAHYNYSSNNQQSQSESNNKVQSKKQWVNIYKPHTFNKMLNGQLNNKLQNNKNQSATHLKRDNKSVQPKNFMDFNEKQESYQKTFTSTLNPVHYGINRANSNSLKKFDFKQTTQAAKPKVTAIQPSKYKIAKEPQTKTFTKPFSQQNYSSKNQQNYMASKLSKQNIDQILKYKLGYPYKYDGLNEQNNTNHHQKYDSGEFPPIEEQTERDSEYITSQRNHRLDQNKMFSIVNSNQYNHHKNWQMEASTKQPNNNNKGHNMNETSYFNNFENTFRKENFSNMLTKNQQQYNQNSSQRQQDYEEEDSDYPTNDSKAEPLHQRIKPEQYFTFEKDQQKINRLFEQSRQCDSSDRISNRYIEITQPVANRLSNISGSNLNINQGFRNVHMIESRQKSEVGNNVQSDLHKSILNSIRKSQEDFPSYSLQSQHYQKQERLSIPKSSPYNQIQSKFYSNPQQHKQSSIISSNKNQELSQTTNQISSFLTLTNETPLNFDTTSFSSTTNFSSKLTPIQKSSINDDNIFTPPDLLNQCRMFLKKSKQLSEINCDFSTKPILHDQSTPQRFGGLRSISRNTNQPFNASKSYVPQKRLMIDDHAITVTESITKDYYFSSQKNSQQKQCQSENGNSSTKPMMESKKVNFQMIGSVKPMQNEYKQFSQHKLKTEQNISYQNSTNKNTSNKKNNVLNQSNQEQKYFQSSDKKEPQVNPSLMSNNKLSETKNMIIQSQQSIQSKKVRQGDVVSYDGIHTFSNQSMSKSKQNSNRKTNRSTFNQVQLFDTKESNKKKQLINLKPITELICLQDLVDQLLEASEGNLQVSTEWLLHTIQNHCYFQEQVTKSLQNVLSVFLNQTQEQIQLMDVFTHLYNVYNSQKNFQFKDGNAKDIYLLLDIQKKGKITIQDIHSFSQSLQQAQIQNFQMISQKLQEMFQLANLSQTNVLTYLNLYIIKNQPVFEQVCQLLQDFQFEIESE